MGKNKQLIINLMTTLIVLVINIGINFGLSKYIVSSIGEEAYGFISLANSFISYATIFTVALNSMASRFITIDIQKGNVESANKYFSSVLIANIFIVFLLVIPSLISIFYLDSFINISPKILIDVKLLFLFIFINFFVSLIGGVFTIATYCTNKLYLSSLKNMESYILKALIIITLFILFKPAIFYVGIATLIAGLYVFLFNIKFTKELLPDIRISKNNFSKKKVKILLFSGLWNSITNLGNVLTDGLDLIISNLVIDASTMGIVALAKVPSTVVNNVISSIANVFQPQIIQYYSKNDINGVVRETEKGMKICGVFGNIPFCYVVAFGFMFCKWWMSDINNSLLSILCIITFINIFTGGLITPLYNIFTITNKVRGNALLNIGSGILSILIVLLLLKITNFGVYAIVGVSTVIGFIKGFIVIPIYSAKCLNVNIKIFFSTIIQYFLTSLIMIFAFYIISLFIHPNSLITIVLSICLCGVIGILINYFVFLNKDEKISLVNLILRKGRKV